MVVPTLSLDNPVLKAYLFYSSISLAKMLFMSLFTAAKRMLSNVFANPEDVKAFSSDKDVKPTVSDPDVERVRRNHLNDLENIPLFVFLGLFFIFTGVSYTTAIWHFRIFTASRIMHTIFYQTAFEPPLFRSLCFLVGTVVNISMIVQIIMATM